MTPSRITKSEVDKAQPRAADYILWDTALKGFGLKVTKAGTKTYVAQYRTAGGRSGTTKRVTIGKHGSPWTAETARDEAKSILGLVATGSDPASDKRAIRDMPTVSALCDAYLVDGVGLKKQSTIDTDKGRIERHIKPLLGKKKVSEVTAVDIRKFLKSVADGETAGVTKTKARGKAIVKGGRGTATRTVGLLGGIFTFAIGQGLISDNPVRGVERYPDRKNERFLTLEEIAALGVTLDRAEAEGVNKTALAIIRLLLLTGARRGEIEKLRWSEVDLPGRRLKLLDSKTGQKNIPLSSVAVDYLTRRKLSVEPAATFVFPASSGGSYFTGTPRIWSVLRMSAGMPDLRIHDLRHSFASVGAAHGTPLLVLGEILGHSDHSTTQRYAHVAENPANAAADLIGNLIHSALTRKPAVTDNGR
ncbi:Putative prophage CPS-53 integrase [Devosia equisanguinis]|uniref:Prophage CPS-53 integrase n=1 Tax=Devosia equisanguinis TaxID=2490941 RepID=A0A447I782_9HYPH|nr:site-specific integrase [Devosia equisanguinis]VDS03359.1 Putative prophage CPS-53 integrase [Devosia equisanguinis]